MDEVLSEELRKCQAVPDSIDGQRKSPRSGVGSIRFSDTVTITERVSKSGGSLVVHVPKEIVELLHLDNTSIVEVSLRKVVSVPIQPSEFERA